jgi:hypothetical protein
MLTLSEYFLNITMVNGNKIFLPAHGGDHVLKTFRVSMSKGANSESEPTGQTSTPHSVLMGRKAVTVTISGYWSYKDIPDILKSLEKNRIVNEMVNIFLPGSILVVTNNDMSIELPINSRWLVDTFAFRRSSTRRGIVVYDLTLIEWYNELVTLDPTAYWETM